MKKTILIALFSFGITKSVYSQQDGQFINYMFNQEVYNSAYGSSLEDTRVNFSTRQQWAGFEGNPKTNTLSFTLPLRKLAVGTVFINDRIGVNNQNYFSINCSYKTQLNYNTFLAVGLNPSFTNLAIENLNLTVYDKTESEFSQNFTAQKMNIGASFFLYNERFYFGYSAPKLFEQTLIDDNATLLKNSLTHYLTGGYIFKITDDLKLKPATLYKFKKNTPLQLDLSLNLLFKNKLNAGFNYKVNNSISTILGIQLKNTFIAYSYDFLEKNNLAKNTMGSHELFIRYDFSKSSKKLLTPRFF
ncbi:PorP/SprF family type IX secretion system membrane protein [Flavobacterium oreochromis]|uniref:PorP/SprF family type IX secretion system membrane protein n=1 Tax=Flavobacterium oreochromis TaxID=2906078 RepID=UPI00385CA434